jgi:hypothetical protein
VDDLPANVEAGRRFGWNAVAYADFPDLLARLNVSAGICWPRDALDGMISAKRFGPTTHPELSV